jgi:uncharacterized membrane protein
MYQVARVSEQTARVYGGIIADRRHVRIVAEIATADATYLTAVAQIPGAGISRIRDVVHPQPPPRPESMNMCLCVCVCVCIHTYIYMYNARGDSDF